MALASVTTGETVPVPERYVWHNTFVPVVQLVVEQLPEPLEELARFAETVKLRRPKFSPSNVNDADDVDATFVKPNRVSTGESNENDDS
jgi:hypothetical protein